MAAKKLLLWSILFLGLLSVGFGQNTDTEPDYPYSVLFLTFNDVSSDKRLADYPISISFENLQYNIKQIRFDYLQPDGIYRYQLSAGPWRVRAWFDHPSTSEPDYYAEGSFTIEEDEFKANRTLYAFPVGSIDGSVVDKGKNLVSGAELQFNCKTKLNVPFPETTNKFGSFLVESVPVGTCKISAAYEKAVGTTEVEIIQGELINIVIELDKPIITGSINYLYIALIILAIAGIGYLYHKRGHPLKIRATVKEKAKQVKGKPKKTTKKAAKKEEKEEGLNPRARDVMKTLNDKETAIINFLLENDNKSTQGTIRNETGIPKTSLARIFQGLEGKNIIKIDKVGKLKKIELTDWFLGKD